MFHRLDLRRASRVIGLLLVLVLMAGFGAGAQANELILHFLDVGQGDSILIQTPKGVDILVDAGDDRAGKQVVLPYLEKMGIESLDMVVMTHPHFDHIGGLIPVLDRYPVGQILADGQIHTTRTYEGLLTLIYEKGIPFYLARAGDKLTIPGLDEVMVLNPMEPFLPGLNNNSVVLKLRYGSIIILLTGDVEAEAEERILAEASLSKVQILKAAHHGSKTSSTKAFLTAVNPNLAIMSVGADNVYGLPDEEILNRFEEANIQVLRTDLLGTIIVVSDGSSFRIVEPGESLFTESQADGGSRNGLVNINTATMEELMELPGIGPTLARRIIQEREGTPFRKLEDLLRVPGIGPKRMENLVPLISF